MTDKYNTNRDLHQRRTRYAATVAPTWDILQTLFGFAFTIQQEIHKLRLETNALKESQPAPPTVLPSHPSSLGRIVASAQNLTEASGAAIALGTEQSMICVARSGVYAPPLGSQLDGRSGLSGECVRTRENVICMNAAADPRVDYKACMSLGIRSMVYLPVLRNDRIVGVLAVFSSKPQHFSHRDLNCLKWTDQLISEALQEGAADIGAATLVRTVEFAEPEVAENESAKTTEQSVDSHPPVAHPPVAAVSEAIAPPTSKSVEATVVAASASAKPVAAPTFVGTVIDEALEDEFFETPEPDPKLAPRFGQTDKYDSPVPMLVAVLLVVAFLGAVSFMTYRRLTSAVNTPTKAAQITSALPAVEPASAKVAEPIPQTTAVTPNTTPGFPNGVTFQSTRGRALLSIALAKPVKYEGFAISGPTRVYFDLRGVSLASAKGLSVPVSDDLVSRVRISAFRPGTSRIVFDLKGDEAFSVNVSEKLKRLDIEISPKEVSDPGAIQPRAGEAVKITSSGNEVLHTPALPAYVAK